MAFNAVYDVSKWIFIGLWVAGNVALFGYTFWKYSSWDEFHYLRSITGIPIAFSRAAAASLNLNCCLVLLPVCRNIISAIRGSCPFGRTMIWRHLDKNLTFHKMCGYTICFWTVVHFIGHTFNLERFIYAQALPDVPTDLRHDLSELPITPNGSWVNPVRSNDTNPMYELVIIIPGWSGLIATLILVIMVGSSTEFIRRNYFEIFWYTHHLFVIFFVMIIVHGFGGIVRKQDNMDKHDYHVCQDKSVNWTKIPECPVPEFKPKEAETWMWVIGPLFLYSVERLIRFARRFQKVELIKVVEHPSRVIELQMRKSGFNAKAGQYIFINCPSIARFQWHPFTLTSAPDDGYFSVHMRLEGDWTKELAKKFHCNSQVEKVNISHLPSLAVDGPFGTCSEDVFQYEVVVLIGAGIGVTPFASILKHIWYKHSQPGKSSPLMKVYFFWVCADTTCFEWFVKVLESLEEKMEAEDTHHFIDMKIHWTRGWNDEQRDQIIGAISDPRDPITRLHKNRTNFGRPNWDQEFDNIAQNNHGKKIGVFFCGPKEMSHRLHEISNRHSTLNGSRFIFNKENF